MYVAPNSHIFSEIVQDAQLYAQQRKQQSVMLFNISNMQKVNDTDYLVDTIRVVNWKAQAGDSQSVAVILNLLS